MNQLYETLIREFGTALGHPELAPDEEGLCALSVDDGEVTLFIQLRDEDTVLIFAEVGRLPDDAEAARALLAANLFGRGTADGTLGLAEENGLVIYSRAEPLRGLDYTHFATIVEVFLDLLAHWRRALPHLGGDQAQAAILAAVGVRV